MSHISVRLTQAVTAVTVAVLVGGSTTEHPQPEEPVASQPQLVPAQTAPTAAPANDELSPLDWRRSKCSARRVDENASQLLTRLVKEIQPQVAEQRLSSLTSDPAGSLLTDLQASQPTGDVLRLSVVDTVCVIRTIDGIDSANKVVNDDDYVWYTHVPGYTARPTAQG